MKILIHEWNNYFKDIINDICNDNNLSADRFEWKFEQDVYDEEFLDWFDREIEAGEYDFVLGVNYFPMLAIACNRKKYKYVSWCYDCPFNITNPEETLGLSTNFCFVFDYKQYLGYKNQGIDTVYHLPLGANEKRAKRFDFDYKRASKYRCDISLVGGLYESDLPVITALLDDQTQGILNELVRNQEELYNYNLYDACITDEFIDYMNSQYADKLKGKGDKFEVNKKALVFALSCEATRRNRLMLLNLFGKKYNTKLYSYNSFDLLKGIEQCGTVDYRTEMPYVFHYSRINLNPSLRCIETGVPLRAFDIMAFGGFLMSNYQQELDEMYINGKDIILYESYVDALEKAEYYLSHEDIRAKIAENGRKKTLENYTLQKAFERIVETVMA